jgi:hypothetical protein
MTAGGGASGAVRRDTPNVTVDAMQTPLIPAQAGIQGQDRKHGDAHLGPRLRGDERLSASWHTPR